MDNYSSTYDAATRTLTVKFEGEVIATFKNVDNDQAFVSDAIAAHSTRVAAQE